MIASQNTSSEHNKDPNTPTNDEIYRFLFITRVNLGRAWCEEEKDTCSRFQLVPRISSSFSRKFSYSKEFIDSQIATIGAPQRNLPIHSWKCLIEFLFLSFGFMEIRFNLRLIE
jgi:hypothetical protein